MYPVFDPGQRRPLLMSGVHGQSALAVTPEMVKETFANSRGRPIPILPGHHARVDDARALGSVLVDELVLNYEDENGKVHDVAILGHTERLNESGNRALSEAEYQYYSPYLKRDATAGWVIEHEGWTNIPRQQGLKPLAFGDTEEHVVIPGPQGRVALAEQGDAMFTDEQKKELNTMVAGAVEQALKPVTAALSEVEAKTKALADTGNTPTEGDNPDDQRIVDLERKLALSDARAAAGEYVARYKGKVPDSYLPILGAIRQQLALSEGVVALADGKEAPAAALADKLAEAIAKDASDREEMSLTRLKLSDSDNNNSSVEAGRKAAERHSH